jgi:hypothetical protein
VRVHDQARDLVGFGWHDRFQVGAAVGIALAGGLIAGARPETLAAAIRPGWLIVATCGLVLLVVARTPATRVIAQSK